MDDVPGEALEPVDLSPGGSPRAEVLLQPGGGRRQGLQALPGQVLGGRSGRPASSAPGPWSGPPGKLLRPEDGQGRGNGLHAPSHVPFPQHLDLLRKLSPQGVVRRKPVIGKQEPREALFEGRKHGAVRRFHQAVQGEAAAPLQEPDGVDSPGVFGPPVHVGRVVLLPWAGSARRRVGPVVGAVGPAGGGVDGVGALLDGVDPLPVGGGVAAVHGERVIEPRVPNGDEVGMEVGNVALGIGEEGVVGGVGVGAHDLQVFIEVPRLGPGVGLDQGLHGLFHEGCGHPLPVHLPHDGPVVGPVHGELPAGHPVVGLVGNRDRPHRHGPLLVAVEVVEAVFLPDDGLEELVDVVGPAGRVHPARRLVEPLVDEELAPRKGSIGVQTLITGDVGLVPEVEGSVGVDEEEGVPVHRVGGSNGDAVGARRLLPRIILRKGQGEDAEGVARRRRRPLLPMVRPCPI